MDAKSKNFLYKYLNANSPTGHETPGQKIWLDYLSPYIDTFYTDVYGTAVGVINPKAKYKVVIEAHADEISWYINHITKEGYMHVIRNGGSDYQIAPSMHAKIHTEKGILPAVFGWPAIHVRKKEDEAKFNEKTVVLDAGFSSKEEALEKGVHVGTMVTFDQDLVALNNGRFFTGRALDNRMGGFMIAEVARRLHQAKFVPPYALHIVNSVQEEVGLQGATMISRRIQPDVAIVTDVTHDTQTVGYDKIKQGDIACGKGPVLTYAPAVHRILRKIIEQVAQKENIPFQRAASSRHTGTDTDAFAYSHTGTASALISLPLKYMHTTAETVHKDDVENVIQLIHKSLLNLNPGDNFNYLNAE
ncbi:MAG: M20/M25/M40 family metallo-hydrolase [Bacteroidota bacterium]